MEVMHLCFFFSPFCFIVVYSEVVNWIVWAECTMLGLNHPLVWLNVPSYIIQTHDEECVRNVQLDVTKNVSCITDFSRLQSV